MTVGWVSNYRLAAVAGVRHLTFARRAPVLVIDIRLAPSVARAVVRHPGVALDTVERHDGLEVEVGHERLTNELDTVHVRRVLAVEPSGTMHGLQLVVHGLEELVVVSHPVEAPEILALGGVPVAGLVELVGLGLHPSAVLGDVRRRLRRATSIGTALARALDDFAGSRLRLVVAVLVEDGVDVVERRLDELQSAPRGVAIVDGITHGAVQVLELAGVLEHLRIVTTTSVDEVAEPADALEVLLQDGVAQVQVLIHRGVLVLAVDRVSERREVLAVGVVVAHALLLRVDVRVAVGVVVVVHVALPSGGGGVDGVGAVAGVVAVVGVAGHVAS